MNKNKTLLALAFVILAVAPMSIILIGEQSNAYVSMSDDSARVWGEGFTTNGNGTLHVILKNNDEFNNSEQITLSVHDKTIDGPVLATSSPVIVPAGGTYEVQISFNIGSAGEHSLAVTGEPANQFPVDGQGNHANFISTVSVTVKESILSKPTTYIAIAVVAILIAIAVFMHMRNTPAKKPDTTFTELEEQKRASKGGADSAPKTSATEKKRYDKASTTEPPKATPKEKAKPAAEEKKSPKEKTQPKESTKPAQEEKKATTFTELEKEKSSKKDAVTNKESSSSEEPKKLKYVSSRRK
ncbi:preprotein translocase subunit SecG [Candidatus Methanoplasma termitum]|uniref:Preprotein translocase subunit SecG n=1 Tax=Candidatus Methanoplasma termitum TaxID=1577791 RepID=A0A0A7LCJ9_9ARCH|nr:hypothetical protein [Candidatus Methanoplasma termitum]AIZ56794.1 preprotein translocase subunit SecG [Candidatus Methanoplasma termitum]